jgi:hypothetical protein
MPDVTHWRQADLTGAPASKAGPKQGGCDAALRSRALPDRGARVAHRLCLDHAENVERVCLMDIAPTLTMYRGTNQELATKYMWWFFLLQAYPLPEQLIGLDPKLHLQHILEALNKTPGAIGPTR